jgi:predicted metalloprotease
MHWAVMEIGFGQKTKKLKQLQRLRFDGSPMLALVTEMENHLMGSSLRSNRLVWIFSHV